MLDKEIAALDEFFKAPRVRQEAVFPYWEHIKKELVDVQKPAHNNGSTCASQIADEIDAEVQVVKNGSAPLDLSKLSHWSRQLRTCR